MEKKLATDYGEVTVKAIEGGIELTAESFTLSVFGEYSVDEVTMDDIDGFIEDERNNSNLM